MSEFALGVATLSLAAALLWGMSPVVAKRGLAASGSALLVALFTTITGTVLLFGAVLVVEGPGRAFSGLSVEQMAIFALGGVIGTSVGRLAHYTGIHRVGASIENAGSNSYPMWASIIALLVLGEPILPNEAVGMVVVVAGLVILSLSKGGDVSGWRRRDLIFPLTAALAFGVGNVIRRYGFVTTPATPLEGAALNALAATVGIAVYLLITGNYDVIYASRRVYAYFTVAGLLVPLGLLALMTALSRGRVVVVVPLAGTAPLFTTIFSYFLLDDLERVTRDVLVAVVMVIAGIGLLSMG